MDAYEYLQSEIHKEVQSIEMALSSGKAKDYNEYQYLCGKIRGLLIAQSKIIDLKERMEKDDE